MTLAEKIQLAAGWQHRRGDLNIAVSIILTRVEYELVVQGGTPKCDLCHDTGRIPVGHSGLESDGNAIEFIDCDCGGEPESPPKMKMPKPDVIPLAEGEELRWGPDTGFSFYRDGALIRDFDNFEERHILAGFEAGYRAATASKEREQ